MNFYGKSDVGRRRTNNQDSYNITVLPDGAYLCTVCDGMGGANGGNIASDIALRVYTDRVVTGYTPGTHDTELLRQAVNAANTAVYEAAKADSSLEGMGTTLVSLLITDDNHATVINVGDSRLYSLSEGHIRQVTRDHSYVQYLVDIGQISVMEAKKATIRNIIIRSVGNEPETNPDIFSLDLQKDSYLLLCSDGLTNCVTNEFINDTVSGTTSLNEAVDALIAAANENGGPDNITAVLGKL